MKLRNCAICMTIAMSVLAVVSAKAQWVGYTYATCPAGSEVSVVVPFNNTGWRSFTVQSVGANSITPVTNTGPVDYTPAAGGFGDTFYVRVMDGSAAGLWTTITNDNGVSLTVEDTRVLSAVAGLQAGDTFRVYKHHTADSLFPGSFEGISHEVGTQIFIYENLVSGKFRNPVKTVVYSEASGFKFWNGAQAGFTVIPPETRIVVRNPSGTELKLPFTGVAPDHPIAHYVPGGVEHDLYVGTGYPVDRVLDNSGYSGVVGRTALLFDNTDVDTFKSPYKTVVYSTAGGFFFWNGAEFGNTTLESGAGYILRLPSSDAEKVLTVTKPY